MVPPRLEIPADLEASIVLLRHGESTHIAEGRFQGQADSPLSALGERQAVLAASRLAAPAQLPALPLPDRLPLEIVHSPLDRAARTARLVADAIASAGPGAAGPPGLRPEPRLMEIAQGSWEGDLRADIEARDAALLAAWRRHPLGANAPGGERIVDAAERARAALADVISGLAKGATGGGATVGGATVGGATVGSATAGGTTAGGGAAGGGSATAGGTTAGGGAAGGGATAPGRAGVPAEQASGYPAPARDGAPWTLLVGHDGIFKVVLLTLLDIPLESFWVFPFALCGITVVELNAGRGILRAHNLVEHLAPLASEARDAQDAARIGVLGSRPADRRDIGGAL